MSTKQAVRPSLIPDARLVRLLEDHLPPVALTLAAITDLANELYYPEKQCSYWTEGDVLRALIDMQERGLADRVHGKGWRNRAKAKRTEYLQQQALPAVLGGLFSEHGGTVNELIQGGKRE